MKITSVVLTVFVAVAAQTVLARYTVGGRFLFDLVLVGVIYAALNGGPVAGLIAGTVGSLAQHVLSADIVGIDGLAKTLIGFAAGAVGAQFVVAKPAGRATLLACASILHRLMLVALHALIDQHWSGVPWAAMLGETAVNALIGLVVFQASEGFPGILARGRQSRRSRLSRREW